MHVKQLADVNKSADVYLKVKIYNELPSNIEWSLQCWRSLFCCGLRRRCPVYSKFFSCNFPPSPRPQSTKNPFVIVPRTYVGRIQGINPQRAAVFSRGKTFFHLRSGSVEGSLLSIFFFSFSFCKRIIISHVIRLLYLCVQIKSV